jgi:hypothetical protein
LESFRVSLGRANRLVGALCDLLGVAQGVLSVFRNSITDPVQYLHLVARSRHDLFQQARNIFRLGLSDVLHNPVGMPRHPFNRVLGYLFTLSYQPLHLLGTLTSEGQVQFGQSGRVAGQSEKRILYKKLGRVKNFARQTVGRGKGNSSARGRHCHDDSHRSSNNFVSQRQTHLTPPFMSFD